MSARAGFCDVAERRDFLLRMSPSCWGDECHECNGTHCVCACHDAAALGHPMPAGPRCRSCGYLTDAPGHLIACGELS